MEKIKFKRVIFFAHVGFYGMDASEIAIYPEGTPNEQIDDDADAFALENAASYGYYPPCEFDDHDYDDDDYYGDKVSDAIEGTWQVYDDKKHGGHVVGNISFLKQFEQMEAEYPK